MKSETVATLAVCTQHDAKSATSEVTHDHSSDGHVHRILRTESCEDHDWQTTEPAVEFTCTCSFPQRRQSSSTARGSADRKVYRRLPATTTTPSRQEVGEPIAAKGAPRITRERPRQTPPRRHPVARGCVCCYQQLEAAEHPPNLQGVEAEAAEHPPGFPGGIRMAIQPAEGRPRRPQYLL